MQCDLPAYIWVTAQNECQKDCIYHNKKSQDRQDNSKWKISNYSKSFIYGLWKPIAIQIIQFNT